MEQKEGEKQSFEERYSENLFGTRTLEKGTDLSCYKLEFVNWKERETFIRDFMLDALSAGYQEASSPVVLPFSSGGSHVGSPNLGTVTQVFFFLKK